MSEENSPTGLYAVSNTATLLYPKLFEAVPYMKDGKPKGEPKFSCVFLLKTSHPELTELQKKAVAVAKEKWPGLPVKNVVFPFKKGDEIAAKAEKNGKKREFYEGMIVLPAATGAKYPPRITDATKGFSQVTDHERLYSGCEVVFEVNFKPYGDPDDAKNPPGITAYLQRVCFVKDGKRIQTGKSDADVFSKVVGRESDEDPTAGADEDELDSVLR